MRTIGTAGGSLNTKQGDYGKRRVSDGQKGERRTVALLNDLFANNPDVVVFNDLRVPGRKGTKGEDANIDHVILSGDNVIVVDSKQWAAGFYFSIAGHGFKAPLKPVKWATAGTVALAVDRLRHYLPQTAGIAGLTLVHSANRSADVYTWALRPRGGTPIYPADSSRARETIRRLAGNRRVADPLTRQCLERLVHRGR